MIALLTLSMALLQIWITDANSFANPTYDKHLKMADF